MRKEVPDAVATCQRAGIVVRMVTGETQRFYMSLVGDFDSSQLLMGKTPVELEKVACASDDNHSYAVQ